MNSPTFFQPDAKVLEQPVVVQSVGTDGRVFQFLVFQLNTTDLASEEGIKNLVWIDSDQLLYQHFWCRPVIRKKVVVVSAASVIQFRVLHDRDGTGSHTLAWELEPWVALQD